MYIHGVIENISHGNLYSYLIIKWITVQAYEQPHKELPGGESFKCSVQYSPLGGSKVTREQVHLSSS